MALFFTRHAAARYGEDIMVSICSESKEIEVILLAFHRNYSLSLWRFHLTGIDRTKRESYS